MSIENYKVSDVELFIGGQASQWIWKEKKEVWKYQRVLQKISVQGNIYQSGKRVDLEVCGWQGDDMYSVYLQLTQIKIMRPYYYSGSWFFFKSRKMYQMFIYWGKSTFSTSFFSFKNVCKMQDLA